MKLLAKHIKDKLIYDQESGDFYWKDTNKKAGSVNKANRVIIGLNRKRYYAARLAWIYTYGDIPKGMCVDHINRNTLDNSIKNLRLATLGQNSRNTTIQSNNSSGTKGIYWKKANNKWYARLALNGKYIWSKLQDDCTHGDPYKCSQCLSVLRKELEAVRCEHHGEFANQ